MKGQATGLSSICFLMGLVGPYLLDVHLISGDVLACAISQLMQASFLSGV